MIVQKVPVSPVATKRRAHPRNCKPACSVQGCIWHMGGLWMHLTMKDRKRCKCGDGCRALLMLELQILDHKWGIMNGSIDVLSERNIGWLLPISAVRKLKLWCSNIIFLNLAEVGSCWDIVEKLETGIEELTTAVIALKPEFSGATQCEVVGSAKHIPLLREGSSMSLLLQLASASIPHKNYLQIISCFKLAPLSAHHNTEQLHR
jgi:hypothetical protein